MSYILLNFAVVPIQNAAKKSFVLSQADPRGNQEITFLSELGTGGGWRGFPYKNVPPAISPSVEWAIQRRFAKLSRCLLLQFSGLAVTINLCTPGS